jgi:hypothetical protein
MSESPKKILIVGGGTAGWMVALHMAHQWADKDIDINLVESAHIGTVGVGEGTTPLIKEFFDRLDIPESEWMPECNATYKCGISFPGWSTVPGYESYFHPFFSEQDRAHVNHFWDNCNLRRNGHDVPAHPDPFFVSTAMVRQFRAPIAQQPGAQNAVYGYHFDAALMGQYFRKIATARGVNRIEDTIIEVKQAENGDIASVVTEHSGEISADFFVDCTGFRGLLIQQTLGERPVSAREYMFNNAAVAMPTPIQDRDNIPSETVSRALKYGWVWHIPLINRMGNGYVYCSDYISPEEAEAELREYLGEDGADAEALHLRWKPGRLERHWIGNCVAVGLSQGFLEPLEALMINVIQRTTEDFVEGLDKGDFTPRYQEQFNNRINGFIDGIRDYLQLHYKLNTRDDTQYWIDARENSNMSEHLATVLGAWDSNVDFDRVLFDHINQQVYPRTSWYCMLAGMGRFPESTRGSLRLPTRHQQRAAETSTRQAGDFWPHSEYLREIYAET